MWQRGTPSFNLLPPHDIYILDCTCIFANRFWATKHTRIHENIGGARDRCSRVLQHAEVALAHQHKVPPSPQKTCTLRRRKGANSPRTCPLYPTQESTNTHTTLAHSRMLTYPPRRVPLDLFSPPKSNYLGKSSFFWPFFHRLRPLIFMYLSMQTCLCVPTLTLMHLCHTHTHTRRQMTFSLGRAHLSVV